MPGPFSYDATSHRYRDNSTGRYVSEQEVISGRDRFADVKVLEVERLTDRYNQGEIDIDTWERRMREATKDAYISEYLLGKGGRNNMTQRDWGILGRELRDQYTYLRAFADDLAAGRITPRQAIQRAKLYPEGSTAAYERARTEDMGMPPLPQYPGDGQTRCVTNCRCHLQIRETQQQWEIFWRLGQAEHCEDCVRLSQEWAPYVVPRIWRTEPIPAEQPT